MNPVVRLVRRHPLASFFVLSYAVAWAFWPVGSFGAFGPLVAALVVVPIAHGGSGLRALGARLIRWRVGWVWWVAALAVPIGVHAATEALTLVTGGTPDRLTPVALTAALMAFGVRLVNPTDGPLAEEPSWRGYAQPGLQAAGHSPLAATTILAVLIAGWHLPLFFQVEGGPTADVVVPGLLTTVAVTYWYGWLFNRSGGSSLLTLVAHNVEGVFSAEGWLYTAAWCLVALGVIVPDRGHWLSTAPRSHRRRGKESGCELGGRAGGLGGGAPSQRSELVEPAAHSAAVLLRLPTRPAPDRPHAATGSSPASVPGSPGLPRSGSLTERRDLQ